MSIGSAINVASGITGAVGKAFGLNTWQLKDGSFNGVTFCSPSRSSMPLLGTGLIGGVMSAYDGITASINSFSGTPTGDTNSRSNLVDTTLSIISMKSDFLLQNVTKQFPYAKESMVEQLGSGGWLHSFVIQIVGQDYMTAIQNLEMAIVNPPTNGKAGQLIHPSVGKINGISSVVNFNFVEEVNLWRGATLFISFMSPLEAATTPTPKSLAQKIFNAVNSCLAAVTSIMSAFAALKGYYNTIKNLVSPTTKNTQLANISTGVTKATNSLTSSANYILKTSSSGAQVSALSNTPLNYSALPIVLNGVEIPATNGVTKTYNDNQGSIIIQFYTDQIVALILDLQPLGGLANNLISELYKSVSTLAVLANAAGTQPPARTYIVPYAMSLSKVLHLNGVNINLMPLVFKNNPQLSSANYLEQGTKVYL